MRDYIRASKSTNTRRAYRSDLADFTLWCADHDLDRLPAAPETIASYIAALSLAGAKPSTIQLRLAAISQFHQFAGHEPSPTQSQLVRMTMAGIRRFAVLAVLVQWSLTHLDAQRKARKDKKSLPNALTTPRTGWYELLTAGLALFIWATAMPGSWYVWGSSSVWLPGALVGGASILFGVFATLFNRPGVQEPGGSRRRSTRHVLQYGMQ